jgi:hypothetical protein
MNKNNLIDLALKEIKEMEVITRGLADFENIPAVMFQLANSKVDNIKDLFDILAQENADNLATHVKEKKVKITPVQEKPIVVVEKEETKKEEPQIIKEELPVVEVKEKIVEKIEPPVLTKKEPIVEQQPIVEEVVLQIEPTPAPKTVEKKPEEHKKPTIAEALIEKKFSVNDKILSGQTKTNVSVEQTLSNKKIIDLKDAINVNDRFRFQRELFKTNATLMNQTLDVLNETSDKSEALDFLSSFEWDAANQTVIDFMELVNRKF